MSAELIGIIAATIALGTAMLASVRGLRQDMRDLRTELREEIRAGDRALRDEIQGLEGRLRDDLKAGDSSIREEMKAGFKELTARMVDIGDRLSKIEGIIEGIPRLADPPRMPREELRSLRSPPP